MLVELCTWNYITSNGLVNGVDGIFKDYTKNLSKIINMDTFSKPSNWTQHNI
jgi:hypothetical protein